MSDEAIPAGTPPVQAESPGKAILFGEHAVVHGRTAVVLALSLTTRLELRRSDGPATTFNGSALQAGENRYLQSVLERTGSRGPWEVRVVSEIPRASGLGSSAAFTTAMLAAVLSAGGGVSRARLAEESFRCERAAQGVGSPVDTSAAVGGGILAVGQDRPSAGEARALWELPADAGAPPWHVARVTDPGWTWVVGYTGVAKDTGTVVRRVGERLKAPDGPALLDRISSVAARGRGALLGKDRARVGALMEENQAVLHELGISHPRLEALLRAAQGHAVGAKITGAGGGGSILALPPEGGEVALARALSRAGGVPYIVTVAPRGTHLLAPS